MRRISSAFLAVAICSVTADVRAVQYAFTNIADSTTVAPNGTFTGFESPVISGGTVAFSGSYSGGHGIFAGEGGPLIAIAKTGDTGPFGPFIDVSNPAISGSAVAFLGSYGDPGNGIFVGGGGPLTTIVKTGDAAPSGGIFRDLPEPPVISGSTVVFRAEPIGGSTGIFGGSGGPLTTIVKTGDAASFGTIGNFIDVDISGDTVSFFAGFAGGVGIFTATSGALTEVVKNGDPAPVSMFGNITEHTNSVEIVAFRAFDGAGPGIFTMRAGDIPTTVVRWGDAAPVGVFDHFVSPAISGNEVAFLGFYGGEDEHGIFIGSGAPLTTVIKSRDPLFGSTVNALRLSRFGIDEGGSGNVAFHYRLADGRAGIAIATPVPEPSTMALLGITLMVVWRPIYSLSGRR